MKQAPDIKFIHMRTGPISVNTFILYREGAGEGFVVDPGGSPKRILAEAKAAGVTLTAQLLTHGHFDHCGASAELQKAGIPVYVHMLDYDKPQTHSNLARLMGMPFETFTPDKPLAGGDTLTLAGITLRVLHTPGHSGGSCCFLIEESRMLFTGDTLFHMSVGRTDFPDGNARALSRSIKETLFTLEGDYDVYPGHDEFTTLDYERMCNPETEYE